MFLEINSFIQNNHLYVKSDLKKKNLYLLFLHIQELTVDHSPLKTEWSKMHLIIQRQQSHLSTVRVYRSVRKEVGGQRVKFIILYLQHIRNVCKYEHNSDHECTESSFRIKKLQVGNVTDDAARFKHAQQAQVV